MVFPLITRSDGTFAVPLVLRVFFAVELSTWRSTSSIRQLLQKVGNFWVLSQHVSSCRDHRKVRTIPKIEVQEVVRSLSKKMGVSFLSSFTWTYLEKMTQLRWKQYQRSRCEMNWSPVSGLMVTKLSLFQVELFLQKGRTCLSIRKGVRLVGAQNIKEFWDSPQAACNLYEQVQVQERIIEAQVRRQETQETWNVCEGFRF